MSSSPTFLNESAGRLAVSVFAAGLALSTGVHGQLAITEVLPSAGVEIGTSIVNKNSDYWELTNFGKETIDLAGYSFTDGGNHPLFPLVAPGDHPLFIRPAESIVFFRSNRSTNETQFRAWLGECLGTNVQVRAFPEPGLSRDGDRVMLFDPDGRLIDMVSFGISATGVSFVYDPRTGAFGYPSVLSLAGTCRQIGGEATGSPGRTTGPIPLAITQQPADALVCRGMTARLQASATGMPQPQYQWFRNDEAIPGATASTLSISNTSAAEEGEYRVVVSNGLASVTSAPARLRVVASIASPEITQAPYDITTEAGRAARFRVTACALPEPAYQWYSNGVPILHATGPHLLLENCSPEMSGTEYCVRITNSMGAASACARLWVSTEPILAITEVQADPSRCAGHGDWFELTNLSPTPIQLLGYRFFDRARLEDAEVIDTPVSLEPGESMIFFNSDSPHRFFEWWGAHALPHDLKLFGFTGFSLSKEGETIYFWNEVAELNGEVLTFLSTEEALPRTTQQFDPVLFPFGVFSVAGEHGAFQAAHCGGDVGSPGSAARERSLRMQAEFLEEGMHLRWSGRIGQSYRVEYKSSLADPAWLPLRTLVATNSLPETIDPWGSASRRFYRVSSP